MSSIFDWKITASNNDTADSDINWTEGQFPNTVNNSARAMMGRVKELLNDLTGVSSTAGTSSALTVTASSAFTTHANGILASFKAHTNAAAGATLNVNSIGGKSLRRITGTGDSQVRANDIVSGWIYVVIYSTTAAGGAGGWIVLNPSGVSAEVITGTYGDITSSGNLSIAGTATFSGAVSFPGYFPSGTRLLFQQTSAPTGWTKVVSSTYNDAALRVVTGSVSTGGSVAFSTAFASQSVTGTVSTGSAATTGSTTLTTAQIPSHTHGVGTIATSSAGSHSHGPGNLFGATSFSGDHTHGIQTAAPSPSGGSTMIPRGGYSAGTAAAVGADFASGNHNHGVSINGGATDAAGSHTHSMSGSTGSAGSDGGHTHSIPSHSHTFTGTSINLAVKYADVIIATKD